MLVLSIDTSLAYIGIALVRQGQILGETQVIPASTYSQLLLPTINFLLDHCQVRQDQIEGLAVTLGPGLFTGLRVGLATVQGFALGLGINKVAGVSSLRLLAENLCSYEGRIWVVTDARKELVYAAPFLSTDNEVQRLAQDAAMSPARLAEYLEPPAILVGNGARLHASNLLRFGLKLAAIWADLPRPGILALLGEKRLEAGLGVAPEELIPHYCRPSDAELRFGLPLNGYQLIE